MKALFACVLASLLHVTTTATAEAITKQEQIQFKNGTSRATIAGKIKGDQSVDYQLRAVHTPLRPFAELQPSLWRSTCLASPHKDSYSLSGSG